MKRQEEDSPRLALGGFLKGKSFTEVLLEVKVQPVRSPTKWEECVSGPTNTNKKE